MRALKNFTEAMRDYVVLPKRDRRWVEEMLVATLDPLPPTEARKLVSALTSGKKQPKVFLSHSHKDKPFVRALARKLEAERIGVWLDEAELNIGDSLIQRLSDAMHEVDFVIAVLSRASASSPWVKEELNIAMTRQVAGRSIRVLPLVKEPGTLPLFLIGKLYADFTTPYRRRRNFPRLVDSIRTHFSDDLSQSEDEST